MSPLPHSSSHSSGWCPPAPGSSRTFHTVPLHALRTCSPALPPPHSTAQRFAGASPSTRQSGSSASDLADLLLMSVQHRPTVHPTVQTRNPGPPPTPQNAHNAATLSLLLATPQLLLAGKGSTTGKIGLGCARVSANSTLAVPGCALVSMTTDPWTTWGLGAPTLLAARNPRRASDPSKS